MTDIEAMASCDGRLYAGMTRADLQKKITSMGLKESDKAAIKLAKAFEIADGLGKNGIKDNTISEEEIVAYDKKSLKKTALLAIGGCFLMKTASLIFYILNFKNLPRLN